ncbi:type II secretion system F family protein [Pseudodesulfovibrio piezophilus]|uniref:Type II secretion system protein n=1 Tax=Pseudodesulfovibrio piezophilus (strain DSM 21447 / JCM 15486 / C1TLV30) TaxID=1322246 RepID=M1WS32_PSEP2|nr:type II secretion system F family protein [Pseudodesulfovibrio piezophilus]CCH48697.1 Type II secretion system protein [Pseudodesulfovibrio piezophilus C1TLV30]
MTNLIPYFAAAVGFTSVLLAGYGIASYFGSASDSARLRERVSGVPAATTSSAAFSDLWSKFSSLFERMGARISPKESEETGKTRIALIQAGLRAHGMATRFQGAKAVMAFVLGGGFLAFRFLFSPDMDLTYTSFGTLGFAAAGIYGPEFWLKKRIANRQLAVANELPDALDLLVVCVESGMGLDQAIERVQRELRNSGPIISLELKILTLELRAGKGRADALRSLSERVGQEDLSSLTSLLVQADIFGISVGRTLRVYSDAMRTKRSQRAEEKAAKLPVLLLLPLITFILPALFIAIMGPAVIVLIDVFSQLNG